MVVLGDYNNGELYLPDLELKLPYRPRDAVFFRSWDTSLVNSKEIGIDFLCFSKKIDIVLSSLPHMRYSNGSTLKETNNSLSNRD